MTNKQINKKIREQKLFEDKNISTFGFWTKLKVLLLGRKLRRNDYLVKNIRIYKGVLYILK